MQNVSFVGLRKFQLAEEEPLRLPEADGKVWLGREGRPGWLTHQVSKRTKPS